MNIDGTTLKTFFWFLGLSEGPYVPTNCLCEAKQARQCYYIVLLLPNVSLVVEFLTLVRDVFIYFTTAPFLRLDSKNMIILGTKTFGLVSIIRGVFPAAAAATDAATAATLSAVYAAKQ